jgi:hypothetical protein
MGGRRFDRHVLITHRISLFPAWSADDTSGGSLATREGLGKGLEGFGNAVYEVGLELLRRQNVEDKRLNRIYRIKTTGYTG